MGSRIFHFVTQGDARASLGPGLNCGWTFGPMSSVENNGILGTDIVLVDRPSGIEPIAGLPHERPLRPNKTREVQIVPEPFVTGVLKL